MIKSTEDFYQVVSKEYIEENLNVFFSEQVLQSALKPGVNLIYLFSEKFVLPVTLNKRGFFWYAHLCVEPAEYNKGNETLKVFLNEVVEYLRDYYHVQWINQNSAASFFMDYPQRSKHIPFGSHVIDLTLSEEELWKNVHTKHRNVIKKSEKDGVEIVSGITNKLIEDYHSMDIETWNRSNRKATRFDNFKKQVLTIGNKGIIYIAYLDGKPQSGAFFFLNKQMCYYMYGANCDRPHTGAGNLLQWHAILDMKRRGILKYSFVGCRINEDENSKYHGIQRFKERFGGKLVQGYMFKVDFNPLMRRLFNFAVTLQGWKSNHKWVPFKDVIDQEIHKWPQE